MATTRETQERSHFIGFLLLWKLKVGQFNTGDVVLCDGKSHRRVLHSIDNVAREVTCSEVSTSESKMRLLEPKTHCDLGIYDGLKNFTEFFLERIRLLLQELIAFFRTNSLLLVKLQVPKRATWSRSC